MAYTGQGRTALDQVVHLRVELDWARLWPTEFVVQQPVQQPLVQQPPHVLPVQHRLVREVHFRLRVAQEVQQVLQQGRELQHPEPLQVHEMAPELLLLQLLADAVELGDVLLVLKLLGVLVGVLELVGLLVGLVVGLGLEHVDVLLGPVFERELVAQLQVDVLLEDALLSVREALREHPDVALDLLPVLLGDLSVLAQRVAAQDVLDLGVVEDGLADFEMVLLEGIQLLLDLLDGGQLLLSGWVRLLSGQLLQLSSELDLLVLFVLLVGVPVVDVLLLLGQAGVEGGLGQVAAADHGHCQVGAQPGDAVEEHALVLYDLGDVDRVGLLALCCVEGVEGHALAQGQRLAQHEPVALGGPRVGQQLGAGQVQVGLLPLVLLRDAHLGVVQLGHVGGG
jgi:hypothetical protein